MSRINETAMLMTLNISQWRAKKTDKRVTKEVAAKHQSDVAMGSYRKSLVAHGALAKLNQLASDARADHNRLTLPWDDGGLGRRILKSSAYFDYAKLMRRHEIAFWAEYRANVKPNYPDMIDDARIKLNGLFDSADYPTVDKLDRKFAFTITPAPVPDSPDFRVDLGDEETARIRGEIEGSVNGLLQTAMRDIWKRLAEVVSKMAERLRACATKEEGEGDGKTFRDSLVTNIIEVLDLVPVLNVTDDAKVNKFAARIRQELTVHTPEVLRSDEGIRKDTAKRAEEILSKMAGYLA
jgi:hypothetical protein